MNAVRRGMVFLTLSFFGCVAESGPTIDDLGRSVDVTIPARRVVTLAPNLTELVDRAGVLDRLVATDTFSNEPEAVKRLPKVGGVQPSLEAIASHKPDLVLASSSASSPALIKALENLAIPLFVVRTDRLADVPRAVGRIGALLGSKISAAAERTLLREIEGQRRARSKKPRVLFLVWMDPLYVAGHDTYMDDLFVLVGAENAVPSPVRGWPQYSMEPLVAIPPDLIFYPRRALQESQVRSIVQSDPRWKAFGTKSEIFVPVEDDHFSRPGPRLVDAARTLNAVLDEWERKQ